MRTRRAVFATLTAALLATLLGLGWHVLDGGGWSTWDVLLFLCLAANAPWLALAGSTGLVGFALRVSLRDPAAAVLPILRSRPEAATLTTRTAIAVCIRLEDIEAVLAPLDTLLRELALLVDRDRFTVVILSDTPDGAVADAEAAAVAQLASRHGPALVRYRRRHENAGYKAGNVMEFLDRHAAGFDHLLLLDADSAMSAATVHRLAQILQADPTQAIVQPTVAGYGAASAFGRLFGFGHRQGVRIWATGQAWWQASQGAYWGHNAIIRIAPFRTHCRLPALPGGGAILSHDLVEAARLHAAGWGVRVLPDDTGSAERHPPDLPALLERDRRWAMGNLQYRHLLRRPDLGLIGRLQMLQAILHYLLTPFWFAPLPLATLNVVSGGADGTPRDALLLLLLLGYGMLQVPKLAGYAEAMLRRHDGVTMRGIGRELLFTLLLDPIIALDRTFATMRLALRRPVTWAPQQREATGVTWGTAARRFGPHTAVGAMLLLAFALGGGWFPTLVALPALAGLLLAIPVCVFTSRPVALAARG